MKPTLEEYVESLKAELKKEIAKREESEYRHAVTAEALEEIVEIAKRDGISWRLDKCYVIARNALNGVSEND